MAITKHTVKLTHTSEDSVNLTQSVADPIYQSIVKNYTSIINDLEDIKKELKKQQSNGFTGNLKTKIGTYISKTSTYIEREKNKQANLKTKYNNAVNRLAISLNETLNDIIKNDKSLEGLTPAELLAGLLNGTLSVSAVNMTKIQDTVANVGGSADTTGTNGSGSTDNTETNGSGSTDNTGTNGSGSTDNTGTNGSGSTDNTGTNGSGSTGMENSSNTSIGIDVGNMTMSEFSQLSVVDKNTVNNILSGNITASVSATGSNVNYFTDASGISYPIMGDPVVILGNGTAVKVPIAK